MVKTYNEPSAELVSAVNKFALKVDQVINDNLRIAKLPLDCHQVEWLSAKWCRIVNSRGSCYAFICCQDNVTKALGQVRVGDIHRPASWKIPAKHARGNVFDKSTWGCVGPYGLAYLR